MSDLHAEWPSVLKPDDDLTALSRPVLEQLIHVATLRFAVAKQDLHTLVQERDRRSAEKRRKWRENRNAQ